MAIDRSTFKQAYKLLQELEADPVTVLRKAAEIYKMAVTDGYYVEQLSPATGETISLHTFAPAVGIQALQVTNSTVKYIVEQLEKEENTGTTETNQLVINLSELVVDK